MELRYKCFGEVATLIRYKRIEVDGERFKVICDGAKRCRVFSEQEKKAYCFEMNDGACDIPISVIEGGVSVSFELLDGNTAYGTPLKLQRMGNSVYVYGGELSYREEIERLNKALLYASDVAERALKNSECVTELEKRLATLETKAHSGDVIK